MKFRKKILNDILNISLEGKICYSDRNSFKEITKDFLSSDAKKIILDCSSLISMDSNGIGMLLLLQEEALRKDGEVTVRNLNGTVKKLFELSDMKNIIVSE